MSNDGIETHQYTILVTARMTEGRKPPELKYAETSQLRQWIVHVELYQSGRIIILTCNLRVYGHCEISNTLLLMQPS
jgi:hypothetical protein